VADDVADQVEIDGGVVVGDDGSECAALALRWAAEEARLRQCTLHVVRAWSISSAPRPRSWKVGYAPSLAEYEEAVTEEMMRDVNENIGDFTGPGLDIGCHAVHAPGAQVLLAASNGADLLVVGSRGRGGFAGLVLGSVTEQVVRHAGCPVVVIRTNWAINRFS
jgi:nucleotide-binding universal stress UspA family protein